MKSHLWYVIYDTIFESSSGMERYSIPNTNRRSYVITETPDIPSLKEEINAYLDNQSRLTHIHNVEYKGEILNP